MKSLNEVFLRMAEKKLNNPSVLDKLSYKLSERKMKNFIVLCDNGREGFDLVGFTAHVMKGQTIMKVVTVTAAVAGIALGKLSSK